MAEDETSLERRPELNLELLSKGGLIVGSEPAVTGSLMTLSGMAIERITRERAEVPPDQRLPENAVYFLDPEARRLIMVSRRDSFPDWKSGLFAETVELDEEGNPRFRLSAKEVIIPQNQYQMVAVGPNEHGLPPSHIDMVEEGEFVPWNLYLANLQTWMNEISVDQDEDFETFMKRFHELKNKSQQEANAKVKTAFRGGPQGFDETVAPFNLIITDDVHREMYEKASRDAGFFPVYLSVRDFVLIAKDLPKWDSDLKDIRLRRGIYGDWRYSIAHFLPADWGSEAKGYTPALITEDFSALWRSEDNKEFVEQVTSPTGYHAITMPEILINNPIFTYVELMNDDSGDPSKRGNGSYHCPNSEDTYREFLYKIKSDLILTMFLRGGAPIVK